MDVRRLFETAVTRSDAAVRAEDLARQEAGGRVRNRVVCVNHVKTELARYLDHLVR